MAPSPDEERLMALEIRMAEQEKIIADLSEMVAAQWVELDRLKAQNSRLLDRVAAAESRLPDGPEPPPPHY